MTTPTHIITVEDYDNDADQKAQADALLARSGMAANDCLEIRFYGDLAVGLFVTRDANGEAEWRTDANGGHQIDTYERVL